MLCNALLLKSVIFFTQRYVFACITDPVNYDECTPHEEQSGLFAAKSASLLLILIVPFLKGESKVSFGGLHELSNLCSQ